MTISVGVIAAVLLALGFWTYYKKNKHIFNKKELKNRTKVDKHKLNDLDKMIKNLAKEQKNANLTNDENLTKDDSPDDSGITENNTNDNKEIIKNSIILERRKKK